MTKFEILSLLISIVGFIAVVISLYFVVRQTRIFSNTLRQSSLSSTMSPVFELSKTFVEHPEMQAYFYSGVNIDQSNKNYEKAKALSLFILDMFDHFMVNKELFSHGNNEKRWDDWIHDMFLSSPILRDTFSQLKQWYPKEILEIYNKAISHLSPTNEKC